MRIATLAVFALLACAPAFAQRPSDPALLLPQNAPELDYVAVADPLTFPAGTTMGAAASVAFDSKGHLWVLNRGTQPLVRTRLRRLVRARLGLWVPAGRLAVRPRRGDLVGGRPRTLAAAPRHPLTLESVTPRQAIPHARSLLTSM